MLKCVVIDRLHLRLPAVASTRRGVRVPPAPTCHDPVGSLSGSPIGTGPSQPTYPDAGRVYQGEERARAVCFEPCFVAWIGAEIGKNAGKTLRSWRMEARVGFEPTNGGFADLSLGPLGYRAKTLSIANSRPSVRASAGNRKLKILYFFVAGAGPVIFASRKNRADSSGGVGLM
jgi:hypothetical protein